jgi:subtilisin family serine protease
VELPAITTTDLMGSPGENNTTPNRPDWITPLTDQNYTSSFSGTSSAAPLAAGVIALVLQANPNLTWRDLRLILAETARKNDATDSDWRGGGPYHHNHKYGFGAIDAQAAVQRALLWANVGPELSA